MTKKPRILAITGGVGGAKLSLGLTKLLPADQLAFVVNTGDDFSHLGLHVSPDIDTLVYTLSGEANPETGWGRRDESWQFMAALRELGGDDWFALGDKDLAMHIERTRLLAGGQTLGSVTTRLAAALGVSHPIFPMCNQKLRTKVHTQDGTLDFQTYFVREKCAPVVTGFTFEGAAYSQMNPDLEAWLMDRPPTGIVICPSNPYVSIDPILQVNGLRQFLESSNVPVIAVSPVVGGEAIKGPTVKMMQELGIPNTAGSVANYYKDFLHGLVLDLRDQEQAHSIESAGIATVATQTVMRTLEDRIELARHCLEFIDQLSSR